MVKRKIAESSVAQAIKKAMKKASSYIARPGAP
jgi:hypothetical protein